jgi:localization factor PodJL
MPASPSEERPLTDRPYDPPRAALEKRIPSRKMHPGLGDDPLDVQDLPVTAGMLGGATPRPESDRPILQSPPPAFDPENVEPPPRPTSSFDFGDGVFSSDPAPKADAPPVAAEATAAPTSRNTFIEAARRAAARPPSKDANANSLISRALARFQQPAAKKAEPPVKPQKPAKQAKPAKPAKEKAKAPEPKVEPMASAEPADAAGQVVKVKPAPVPGSEPNESFLAKHRQPILLAASVVALSFLTINLINQRQAEEAAGAIDGTAIDTGSPQADVGSVTASSVAPAEEPAEPQVNTAAVPARVIPIVDSLQTGSINPATAQSFGPGNAMPAMPSAFKAIEDNTAATIEPPVLDGPVKVELPPESIGPADLRQSAADGDSRAQFEVAAIYTEGRAVPQDLEAAATWYERAAAQGFAPAQYRLGNLYENGKGVEKDLEQARLWYQRAAEAGNRMSMHNLAALYAGGELGKQDFVAAAGWFEKAAGQGLTDSQFNLGMLYARGLGVPQNMEASYKWFALAARSGDQDAAKARDDIAGSLDADTVTRLAAEVETWKPSQIDLPANYAPIGTWSQTFDPGQVIDNPEVILGVQTLLNRLGYDVGIPDGVAGPRTAEAIKSFEAATGMSQVGAINPRLLAVLGSQPG